MPRLPPVTDEKGVRAPLPHLSLPEGKRGALRYEGVALYPMHLENGQSNHIPPRFPLIGIAPDEVVRELVRQSASGRPGYAQKNQHCTVASQDSMSLLTTNPRSPNRKERWEGKMT